MLELANIFFCNYNSVAAQILCIALIEISSPQDLYKMTLGVEQVVCIKLSTGLSQTKDFFSSMLHKCLFMESTDCQLLEELVTKVVVC